MTLTLMKKKQNTRRNIAESIHKIYWYGMFVNAGFILGFDSEKGAVADAIVELIQDAAIPLSIVGLLYALPGTQLTRRVEKEGPAQQRPENKSAAGGCLRLASIRLSLRANESTPD
jgi:hypothetical protein